MKKGLILLFILAFFGCEKKPSYPWVQGNFNDALKQAEGKLVLVDFETDWCVWCKRLDEDTYPDSGVIAFARANLVSVKVDAEKGEGIELARHYNISGYPTLVLMDQTGKEVDRIIGYRPPEMFLAELTRIHKNEGTLPDLEEKRRLNPKDEEILTQLARKYEDAGYKDQALDLWSSILDLKGTHQQEADFKIAYIRFYRDSSTTVMEEYLANNPSPDYAFKAYSALVRFFRKTKAIDKETAAWMDQLRYAESHDLESPNFLNAFAWRMAQLEQSDYYDLALEKVRKAVMAIPDSLGSFKAAILDTEAEVLWKLGRAREAAEKMEAASILDPENDSYRERKEKFLKG
ncbi:MAG: thioredoxin fold domain-containing protein [Fidelibacterota bacterium]